MNERGGVLSTWGEGGSADITASERNDRGVGSLPLIVSLALGDGTGIATSDDPTGLNYHTRKPLQRMGEADPAFVTKRVRIAIDQEKLVVKVLDHDS